MARFDFDAFVAVIERAVDDVPTNPGIVSNSRLRVLSEGLEALMHAVDAESYKRDRVRAGMKRNAMSQTLLVDRSTHRRLMVEAEKLETARDAYFREALASFVNFQA